MWWGPGSIPLLTTDIIWRLVCKLDTSSRWPVCGLDSLWWVKRTHLWRREAHVSQTPVSLSSYEGRPWKVSAMTLWLLVSRCSFFLWVYLIPCPYKCILTMWWEKWSLCCMVKILTRWSFYYNYEVILYFHNYVIICSVLNPHNLSFSVVVFLWQMPICWEDYGSNESISQAFCFLFYHSRLHFIHSSFFQEGFKR